MIIELYIIMYIVNWKLNIIAKRNISITFKRK